MLTNRLRIFLRTVRTLKCSHTYAILPDTRFCTQCKKLQVLRRSDGVYVDVRRRR